MIQKRIAPTWRDVRLVDISKHDVQAWASTLLVDQKPVGKEKALKALKPASVRRVLNVFVSSLSSAVDANLIDSNPALSVKLPPNPQGKEVFLTQEQFKSLMDAIDHKEDAALVTWLAYTGMRFESLLISNAGVSGDIKALAGVRAKAAALGKKIS